MTSQTLNFDFLDRGFEKTLVLIPGWASDYRIFSRLNLDYNYIFLKNITLPDFNRELFAALESFKKDKVSILGLSLGGFLAVEFALNYPDKISEIFLVGVRKKYPEKGIEDIKTKLTKNKKAYLYKFYEACFPQDKDGGWQDFKASLLNSYVEDFSLESLLEGLDFLEKVELKPALFENLSNISFFHSRDDKIAPYNEARDLAKGLGSCRFVSLTDFGHIPVLNAQFRDRFYAR